MSAPKLTDSSLVTLPVQPILKEVSRRIVGQDAMVERLLVGLLTGGLLSGAVLTETVFAFTGIEVKPSSRAICCQARSSVCPPTRCKKRRRGSPATSRS